MPSLHQGNIPDCLASFLFRVRYATTTRKELWPRVPSDIEAAAHLGEIVRAEAIDDPGAP